MAGLVFLSAYLVGLASHAGWAIRFNVPAAAKPSYGKNKLLRPISK